ncbi:glycosyltransferase [Peribacillus sp. Hz7]|uniref:glycosyltransferase n=1 Tax=Peribacillus sp. Hz7 TaxID=3344873 RepID=UPI0035C953A1
MKKKILFLITSLGGGGAEKVLIDLVKNLDPLKYEITVQTVLDEGIYIKQLPKHVKYKTIIKQKNKYKRSILIRLFYYILSPKFIYEKYIKSNYDIEIAFLEGICTKFISASTNKNAKKYAWIHTDLSNQFAIKKVYNSFKSIVSSYRQFDEIMFVSESAKEGFKKRFGYFENTRILYNIVDPKQIVEKGKLDIPEKSTKDKFRIVTVGRLVKEKGYDRLLEVHKSLINEGFKYELWIIGDGIEKNSLINFIETNNLNENVKLFGFQKNPYRYMSKCDLFVCSSRVEGFSTVVTEALILKLPIVTTNCSGMNELLGNGEYGVITENSTDGLYKGLKNILSDTLFFKLYQDKAIQRSNFFSLKGQIKQYENLFDMSEEKNESV